MSSADGFGEVYRALLAAGTASYDFPDFPTLGKVPDALRIVVGALEEFGFRAVAEYPGYSLDPALADLRAAVRKAASAAPVVVVYYTGHGADLERGTYYLVSKESHPANLDESALAARDLLTLLTLRDNHGQPLAEQPTVLVILDCCYSSSAGMVMFEEALRGVGNPSTWVIASAGPLEYAQQGLFAKAFSDALKQPMAGSSQRFVSLEAIVQAINDAQADIAEQQARVFPPGLGLTGIPPFFPNPYYQPGLAGMAVSDQQHWLSRVRSGPDESTVGFYLTGKTGRLRAARDLAEWLTHPEPKDLAVVTGSPGTGKSALLSLPVLLTEHEHRQGLLRTAAPGSLIEYTANLLFAETPVTAIHARGLNTDQAANVIAQALGRQAHTASRLLEVLDSNPQRDERAVVVDAVDEAISPRTLLDGLLVPLSRRPGIRVVVAARRHVLEGTVRADVTIDLDTAAYRDPQALIDYVRRLLVAAEEPDVTTCYQPGSAGATPEVIAEAAETIARRATARDAGTESFLLGRLLALSVRGRAKPADVTSPDWQSGLPANAAEAFDEDLARLGPEQPLARALLGALAWAKGPGLPWETIWVPVARALAEGGETVDPSSITNADIRWLLDKAGAYVVEDAGPGERSVFRPFHDLLATHLRGEPSAGQLSSRPDAKSNWQQRRQWAENAITEALLTTVPTNERSGRDWIAAHPYLRTYLAQHAASAGTETLAALVQDMDFLAVADPVTLTPLLSPTVPELRGTARIYRRARPLLGDDIRANNAYLQEADRTLMGTIAAPEEAVTRPLYRTYFGSVVKDDSLLTFPGHFYEPDSVAFTTTTDGTLLLASASRDDGTVRLWDPLTGAPVGEPLATHSRRLGGLVFGTTAGGRLLLASASRDDGTVRLWDPLTRASVGEPLAIRSRGVDSLALGTTADGRLLLASASGDDGTVRLWDPLTGALVGKLLTGYSDGVDSMEFGITADGRLLLTSTSRGDDVTVRLWDALTGAPVGEPLTGHRGRPVPVAFGTTTDGQLLLATGSDERVALWDPLTGAPVGEPLTGHSGGAASLAFGTTADGQLLLASAHYPEIQLWDAMTGTPIGNPLTGHTARVLSVAFGTTADGRLLLASASPVDGTARLWNPLAGTAPDEPFTGHSSGVVSVSFGVTAAGRLLLASAGFDQVVRLWDPMTGTPVGKPLAGWGYGVISVAFGTTADGHLLLATAASNGTVQMWDPLTGTPINEPFTGHSGGSVSVALGTTADGRLLLAYTSGATDGTIQLWDALTGPPAGQIQAVGWHLDDHVSSVAFGTTADGHLLLACAAANQGTVQLWDPLTRAQVGQTLTGHSGSVYSVAFGTTADGQMLLASADSEGSIRLWNPLTGADMGELLSKGNELLKSVAFGTTADGHLLLTSAGDRTIQMWDPATRSCIMTVHRRSDANSVAMFGRLLAIGDDEGVCVLEPLP
jgi:WD40 repeat protein